VIKKTDLYPLGILKTKNFCKENEFELIGKISFDTIVTEAMVQGEPNHSV
jgi:MinD superfamily P-loop ATPase